MDIEFANQFMNLPQSGEPYSPLSEYNGFCDNEMFRAPCGVDMMWTNSAQELGFPILDDVMESPLFLDVPIAPPAAVTPAPRGTVATTTTAAATTTTQNNQQVVVQPGESLLLNSRSARVNLSSTAQPHGQGTASTQDRPDTPQSLDGSVFHYNVDLTISNMVLDDDLDTIVDYIHENNPTASTEPPSSVDSILGYLKSPIAVHHPFDTSNTQNVINKPSDYQHFNDHSYTLPQKAYDTRDLGVQTPSDSEEEELDVGITNPRTLPTNPSPRNRRDYEKSIANRFSEQRVVRTNNGVRTLPPVRRHMSDEESSIDLEYPMPSSMSTPSSIRSPLQSATPTYQSTMAASAASASATRRRRAPAAASAASHGGASNKKYRTKRAGKAAARRNTHNASMAKYNDAYGGSTAEENKRTQHNEMERHRRIGLKMMFDQLRTKIPSLEGKEKAPKVTILNEAEKFVRICIAQEAEYDDLVKKRRRLEARFKYLQGDLNKGKTLQSSSKRK